MRKLAPSLAEPLMLVFSSFMSVGQVPDEWRRAVVTPIYKGGIASDVSNYRPISLTCVFCKIMERVIVSVMSDYFQRHGLISKQQHGFLSKRSTTTNLLETLNEWTLALNDKASVVTAYIDYSKAFDVVSHNKLLYKLAAYGISGNLLKWIESFFARSLTGNMCWMVIFRYRTFEQWSSTRQLHWSVTFSCLYK